MEFIQVGTPYPNDEAFSVCYKEHKEAKTESREIRSQPSPVTNDCGASRCLWKGRRFHRTPPPYPL